MHRRRKLPENGVVIVLGARVVVHRKPAPHTSVARFNIVWILQHRI